MSYVSAKQAALMLGVSDAALLDWMERDLIPTDPGPDGTRRLSHVPLEVVLARLPTHSGQHGLSDAQVEAILVRDAGHAGERRFSTARQSSGSRLGTAWAAVKGFFSALLESGWPW